MGCVAGGCDILKDSARQFRKFQKHLNMLMNWEWPRFYGVICEILSLKWMEWIIIQRLLTRSSQSFGVTIQADIIKQKLPTVNGGFNAIKFEDILVFRLSSMI